MADETDRGAASRRRVEVMHLPSGRSAVKGYKMNVTACRNRTNKSTAVCCCTLKGGFFSPVKRDKPRLFILGVEPLTKDHKTTCGNTQGPYLNPRVVEGILDGQPFSRIHK